MPTPASRKRPPAAPRDTKEAERAAKKVRQAASKAGASDTPRTSADRGAVGGEQGQSGGPIPPSPPRASDPISAPVPTSPMTTVAATTTPTTPIMTTTSPIATTNRSTSPPPIPPRPSSPQPTSPRPTSPRPTSPRPTSPRPTSPPAASAAPPHPAPPTSAVVTSASGPQASPPRPTKESVILLRSVDQFRAEYSRTGHVGKEPDASYRYPVTSHGPMNSARHKLQEFVVAMTQDLQQIDRNHAVCFFCSAFSFSSFLHSVELSSSGCAQAHPLGVVPEIRTDCCNRFGSSKLYFTFPPSSNRRTQLPVGALVHLRDAVPEIQAEYQA